MSLLPILSVSSSTREFTETFAGYNHNLKTAEGEWYDTQNLTIDRYPVLSERTKRGICKSGSTAMTLPGGLIEKDNLAYVDNGKLYYYTNGGYTEVMSGLSTSTQKKQLVSMGAYICIFPDAKYFNTEDFSDKGDMGASWQETVNVTYKMCNAKGEEYATATESSTPPANPTANALWIDTENTKLFQWSANDSMWSEITTVYTKVTFSTTGQLPSHFSELDGVQIAGLHDAAGNLSDDLNGSKIIYGIGGRDASEGVTAVADYIVIVGICETEYSESNVEIYIHRDIPTLDWVCECQNRLWGCRYGNDGTQNINELYCCTLGDFKNWEQYLGLSTDSWRASVGSDGKWTGAVNYLGYPTFFKENRIHAITVSSTGAHQVDDLVAPGIQDGSGSSAVVVETTLLYKGRNGVFGYQGSFPGSVSAALGEVKYSEATAGAFGSKYYISMKNRSNEWNLFVYDLSTGVWLREDDLHVLSFAKVDDSFYCVDSDGRLLDINGIDGTAESSVEWKAESGTLYYSYPDKKYVSRFDFRMSMASGSTMSLYIEYDSSGIWEKQGNDIVSANLYTRTIPVRPRRCDHLRIKLTGKGTVRLYSIAKILETGSDY